ncbi:MAG: LysR family transcriptional regulator [Sedimenticola sp.]|nr:LysR family transcriptional regulator [Sedimenticola sp.]
MNDIYRQLRRLDLNLLVVFDALMREQSVSKAAQRCFLSQPAMSNALKRLRGMLDDPVLVRTTRGMMPSPRAQALAGTIRSLLNQLGTNLQPPAPFDPQTSRRDFTIALTSYGENVLLPEISHAFCACAPGARVDITRLTEQVPLEALERGEIDLVVGVREYLPPQKQLRSEPYLRDRLVCVAKKGRRRSRRLSLRQFLAHRHVYPTPLGIKHNIVDEWLARQDTQRDIAVSTHSYLVAARIVSETDYLLSLPSRIAEQLVGLFPLEVLEPPTDFPAFELNLIWHPLYENEPAIRWLLELMRRLEVAGASG